MRCLRVGCRARWLILVIGGHVAVCATWTRAQEPVAATGGADLITSLITGIKGWPGPAMTFDGVCSMSGLSCVMADDCKTCSVDTATTCAADGDCPAGQTCVLEQRCDGIAAFSIGTESCNVGDVPINWCDQPGSPYCQPNEHPVIAQNIYRLQNNVFSQIGMSWVKHGFFAVESEGCGLNCVAFCTISGAPCDPQDPNACTGDGQCGTGDLLNVGCSDIYGFTLNGNRNYLGPRFEINAHTGTFPFPPTLLWQQAVDPNDELLKRLQIHTVDLVPELNPGALYFAEAQYVAADEAAAGNADDNASYRPVAFVGLADGVSPDNVFIPCVSGVLPSGQTCPVQGGTMVGDPAIRAWKATDPAVVETDVPIPGDGLFIVAGRAVQQISGFWRYTYAVHNLNADRAGGSFSVPLLLGATVQGVGFNDVDYHSTEPLDGTDWSVNITNTSITWTTTDPLTTQACNQDGDCVSSDCYIEPGEVIGVCLTTANALRWSTLYSFWFETDLVPTDMGTVTLGLFKPGTPTTMVVSMVAPDLTSGLVDCNNNGRVDSADVTCEADMTCGGIPGSADCDINGVPDECQPDCDNDGTPDACRLQPIGDGMDCDGNGVPDECDPDCDGSGTPDACDILNCAGDPACEDCWPLPFGNGVPDACDLISCVADDPSCRDCNFNEIPDGCEQNPVFLDTDDDGIADCLDNCPFTSPVDACRCDEPIICCIGNGCDPITAPENCNCIPGFFTVEQCLISNGFPSCIPEDLCHAGCPIGDSDNDGDFDLHDAARFQNCFSGVQSATIDCQAFFNYDINVDDNVDLEDYFEFFQRFNQP